MPIARKLPMQIATGATLMSQDEVLLESAAAGVLTLRFYQWAEPTLSLGYFQPSALRLEDPLLQQVAWVRRSSGGNAILHHHELTYSLAIPAEIATRERESWLCKMHHLLIELLAAEQILARGVACGEEKKLDPFLCFLHQTAGDLLIQESKVVGSAQRRIRGAILQHGSILFAQSPFTPKLPGIQELSGIRLQAQSLEQQLTEKIAQDWGWQMEKGDWTNEERSRIEQIQQEKYGNPAWNSRR